MGVWDDPGDNARALRAKAFQAFTMNAAFLANGSPTQAEAVTQLRILTREMNGLLRLLFNQYDDISDT